MRLPVVLLFLSAAQAALLAPPGLASFRFRGGADFDLEDDLEESAQEDETDDDAEGPLTEAQVIAKLNEVPTFVLMGEEGGFVALTLKDKGRAICFFTEPEEAKAVLNMTVAQHPDVPIRLTSVGLGSALKLCTDSVEDEEVRNAMSAFEGDFKLQGSHALVSEVSPQLKAMLAAKGMDEGGWLMPVFICEEIANSAMVPIFLNPREIHTAWQTLSKKQDLGPLPNKYVMMDIRMLVADMRNGDVKGMPWSKVVFIGAEGAAQFANELQAQQAAGAS